MLAVRGLNSKMLEKRLHGCLLLLVFLLADVSGSRAETAVDLGPDSEDGSKRRSLATTMFCVAKQGADATALQAGLNWACGQGRANCAPIQPGGPCYKQNDLEALASYAYNDYYQKNFATGGSCGFNGTATTTTSDPSSGQCVFTGSSMAGGGTPAASAPSGLSPPSSFTPGIGSPSNTLIPLDGAESLVSSVWSAICAPLLALPLFFL